MPDRNGNPRPCGFCMTGHHDRCTVESLPWYGKTWKCECSCEKGTKAVPTKTAKVEKTVDTGRKAARVRKVAQKELDKVLASDEVRKVVKSL